MHNLSYKNSTGFNILVLITTEMCIDNMLHVNYREKKSYALIFYHVNLFDHLICQINNNNPMASY
jgi:hypothetical protein